MRGFLQGFTTVGTKLGIGRQRSLAFGAGGADCLPPVSLREFLVLFRHGGMRPDLFHGARSLSGRHFNTQIRRTALAKAAFFIPAILTADPGLTAGALHKGWFDLPDGICEGGIMRRLPARAANLLTDICRRTENTSEDITGRIQNIRDRSGSCSLKGGSKTGTAAVAIEFKLKSGIGAQIIVVVRKFNHFGHKPSLRVREKIISLGIIRQILRQILRPWKVPGAVEQYPKRGRIVRLR